jgi:single-stranded DNA-binding protein
MGMSTEVVGNLLQNPEQRVVRVKGEDRKITEVRVFADYYKNDGNGELIQDDDKCVAVEVTIWSEKLGNAVMDHFRKGARVIVTGDQYIQQYVDKDDKARFSVRVDAEMVALVPYRVEEIRFKAKRQEPAEQATG